MFFDDLGITIWGMLVSVVLFVCVFVGVGVLVGRHYDHVKCDSFARNTERETRFVVYNFFQWDCLTPTANGKWIPISNLREFGDSR